MAEQPPSVPAADRQHPLAGGRWPCLALTVAFVGTGVLLRSQGRLWWCACGSPALWSGDPNGPHNSQHFLDPYSFTHVLHGVVFYGLLAWAAPRLAPAWRLVLATVIEGAWELFENSAFVIDRYRTATAAVGYEGDSVANSLGDILCCVTGYLLARKLGLWWSVVLFFVTEAVLLLWIRDDLFLSVLMLLFPLPGIKAWQTGG
jgi:hypothetical protein